MRKIEKFDKEDDAYKVKINELVDAVNELKHDIESVINLVHLKQTQEPEKKECDHRWCLTVIDNDAWGYICPLCQATKVKKIPDKDKVYWSKTNPNESWDDPQK